MKKVVLAYSGGLDTSIILKWLINQGYEVVCFCAHVGQQEAMEPLKEKALKLGASRVYIEDLRKPFVEEYIFQALKANALYEGKYLLGTALARPLMALKQIEIAKKEQTTLVAHGATGKGNDQVRFEIAYLTLMPEVTIVSPWKNSAFLAQFKGRSDMIAFAQQEGIPISSSLEKPFSIDENLMHVSYEGGLLEKPSQEAPSNMFKMTSSPLEAPDEPEEIAISFKGGIPIAVTNLSTGERVNKDAVTLFSYLNEIAGKHGIGRVDLIENRFVGMKSRGVYETPAGTLLWQAHADLETLVLDREVLHLKQKWMPKIAELIYYGFWFSPEMAFLMAAIEKSQEHVEGTITMKLYKGSSWITKRESKTSLYSEETASMDRLGDFDQLDAKGFIKLSALRLKHQHTCGGIK